MLTIIIAVILGGITFFSTRVGIGNSWGIFCGVIVVILTQVATSLIIRKKVNEVNKSIQDIMMDTQNKLTRKMNMMQQRNMGSPKSNQQVLEKEQNASLRRCLDETKRAEKYFIWNILLKKQINSMRMMLHFQLKEFKKVDELLPKSLVLDPRSIAIKAVRMYKNNDPKTIKYLTSKCKSAKGENAVFLYSLTAWMLVKMDKIGEAAAILAEAKTKSDDQIILDNHARLANGKVKHFSNAALGDNWYSLYLEEPKVKQQRVVQRGY